MNACDDIRLDLPAYVSNELSETRKLFVDSHLAECDECSAVLAELSEASELAAALPLEFRPPRRLEEKTFALIELEREKEQRAAPLGTRPSPTTTRLGRAAEESRRRWFSPRVLLAPGLAAAFITLAVVAASLWAQNSDLEQQLEQATGESSGESVAQIELTAGADTDVQATAELIELEGDNFKIVLDTSELPAPPKDYHYELWLGTGENGWASAGTFVSAGADETYEFMTAVDPLRFPVIDITLEREDGEPSRDGEDVMRGRVDLSEIGA